ncbi:hypothetical protein GCM10017709_23560 [Glutamicibacter nicotianae]|uniref:Isochorismatase-like domain-containing protein n=1 Tax=Glutamicibacter nicotianae TaxID=37929 RepID=A0ABQ0RJJ2_GLUNI|nr:hypothetical protein ANI01nite_11910 [Glutamicibacter nicotianae]
MGIDCLLFVADLQFTDLQRNSHSHGASMPELGRIQEAQALQGRALVGHLLPLNLPGPFHGAAAEAVHLDGWLQIRPGNPRRPQ